MNERRPGGKLSAAVLVSALALKMKRRLFTLLTLATALAFVQFAMAHASLAHSIPRAGSTVHRSPTRLSLWFSETLDPTFSKAEVLDGSGTRVDKGDPQVDSTDGKLLQISLPALAPGKYRVTWRVLSADTHVSQGEFTFYIAS